MEPLEAFQLYSSLKLHFEKPSYDFAKYGLNRGRFNADALRKRNDKYQFVKLANEYPEKEDLEFALASIFVHKPGAWVGKIFECKEFYYKHKAYIGNPLYNFKSDINGCLKECNFDAKAMIKPSPNKTPPIYRMLMKGDYNLQTFTLLERTVNIITYYEEFYKNKNPAMYDIIYPELIRLKKLAPFIRIDNTSTLNEMKDFMIDVLKSN
jgi:hypothetical protein